VTHLTLFFQTRRRRKHFFFITSAQSNLSPLFSLGVVDSFFGPPLITREAPPFFRRALVCGLARVVCFIFLSRPFPVSKIVPFSVFVCPPLLLSPPLLHRPPSRAGRVFPFMPRPKGEPLLSISASMVFPLFFSFFFPLAQPFTATSPQTYREVKKPLLVWQGVLLLPPSPSFPCHSLSLLSKREVGSFSFPQQGKVFAPLKPPILFFFSFFHFPLPG